jgi:hypothetical protein
MPEKHELVVIKLALLRKNRIPRINPVHSSLTCTLPYIPLRCVPIMFITLVVMTMISDRHIGLLKTRTVASDGGTPCAIIATTTIHGTSFCGLSTDRYVLY